jgi:16S rRNA (guanine1207-N2)-methyltransferase
MDDQHYFSSDPAVAARSRSVPLTVAGRRITVRTASGVFSADRLDLGTAVLLKHLPAPPPRGDLLDLGCGWGPLTLQMAASAPEATVWAVDVNSRALELTARNAADQGRSNVRCALPQDVPPEIRFAAIWSNPPIRIGKPALHELLRLWLGRLEPEGLAHLVVQRNLGADSLQRWIAEELAGLEVRKAASSKGYRVLRVAR